MQTKGRTSQEQASHLGHLSARRRDPYLIFAPHPRAILILAVAPHADSHALFYLG